MALQRVHVINADGQPRICTRGPRHGYFVKRALLGANYSALRQDLFLSIQVKALH